MDVESHRPVFLIEQLHVTAAAQTAGTGGEEQGLLEARLDVFGVEAQPKPQ